MQWSYHSVETIAGSTRLCPDILENPHSRGTSYVRGASPSEAVLHTPLYLRQEPRLIRFAINSPEGLKHPKVEPCMASGVDGSGHNQIHPQ